MLEEKVWQSLFQVISKVFDEVEPNSSNHVFMDLALCTGGQSCWNTKEPSPNNNGFS